MPAAGFAVVEQALKGIVVAVVAAGLGDVFQFQIGGIGKIDGGPLALDTRRNDRTETLV